MFSEAVNRKRLPQALKPKPLTQMPKPEAPPGILTETQDAKRRRAAAGKGQDAISTKTEDPGCLSPDKTGGFRISGFRSETYITDHKILFATIYSI